MPAQKGYEEEDKGKFFIFYSNLISVFLFTNDCFSVHFMPHSQSLIDCIAFGKRRLSLYTERWRGF